MNMFYFDKLGVGNDRENTVFVDTSDTEHNIIVPMTIGYFYEVKNKFKNAYLNYEDFSCGIVDDNIAALIKNSEDMYTDEVLDAVQDIMKSGVVLYRENCCIIMLNYVREFDKFEVWVIDAEISEYTKFTVNEYSTKVNELKVISREY